MSMITSILAGILSTVLTKLAWEKLVLRVTVNLLRYAEKNASNQAVKDVLDSIADELEAVMTGKPSKIEETKN